MARRGLRGLESLGGVILDKPDCVAWGPNRIDCFARGTDLAMHHRWWHGAAWGGWESLGGVIIEKPRLRRLGARTGSTASPAAPTTRRITAGGTAQAGAAGESLGGIILSGPDSVAWGPDRLDCFAPGTDNAMYHRWWG